MALNSACKHAAVPGLTQLLGATRKAPAAAGTNNIEDKGGSHDPTSWNLVQPG
jgi:hypothetical protein